MNQGVPTDLETADGLSLEGALSLPSGDVVAAMTLAHPHPAYGGDMHAGVVGLLPELLVPHGIAVLRWNFRGVGRSAGAHAGGADEPLDVVAALDHLDGLGLGVPIHLAGWSFGADVSLAVEDERHAGWIGIAPPLSFTGDAPAAGSDERPTLLLVPEHDQFRPPAGAEAATAAWTATEIEVVGSTDHFLGGRTSAIAERIVAAIS
ncbi:MAG: alpha/beta hydrolase [Actinomycetota bacterium]